ncbi:MAG: hypothetical protein HY290_09545 [Planctomycetia bacterium]|nr:hypothetical protein [Planctomycetia bacterium]
MMPKPIRAALLCLATVSLGFLSGCCGCCCNVCKTYEHPEPSCVGLRYAGCCTCKDDCRDRVNQLTDILLP